MRFVPTKTVEQQSARINAISGGTFIQCRPLAACHTPEQLHQGLNLDGFERTHGILYLAAQPLVGAADNKPVKLFDGIFPPKRIRRHSGEILNFMLDRFAVLQPDDDFGGHLSGILVREFLVWPD
jgi:hypothetical protein